MEKEEKRRERVRKRGNRSNRVLRRGGENRGGDRRRK